MAAMIQLPLWGVSPHPLPPSPLHGEWEARSYDTTVIQELRWLNRRCGPVSAAHLAGFIGKSPRMTQIYMNRLADTGAVERVGVRGGWLVVMKRDSKPERGE